MFTYPITTVRTRIQQNQFVSRNTEAKYKNTREITSKLMKDEGVRGFYKGFSVNFVKGVFQKGIYFIAYEALKKNFAVDDANNPAH